MTTNPVNQPTDEVENIRTQISNQLDRYNADLQELVGRLEVLNNDLFGVVQETDETSAEPTEIDVVGFIDSVYRKLCTFDSSVRALRKEVERLEKL